MRKWLVALACVTAIYVVTAFLVMPQEAFFSSDEGLKFIQVQSFARKGYRDLTLDYPGRELDPNLDYVPINNPPLLIRDGKLFAVYPIFFPMLVTPLYRIFKEAGLYLVPLLSGLLTLVVTHRLARLCGASGPWSIVLLGLGTPILFYSVLFWDHILGTLLSSLAILLIVANLEQPRHIPLLLAGMALGLAIWVRSELYVLALVIPGTYLLLGRRRFPHTGSLCLGVLAGLLPLWLFQLVIYGDFLGPHVTHFDSLIEEVPVTTDRMVIIYHTLAEGSGNLVLTFLFIMAFVALALLLWLPRLRTNHLLVSIVSASLVFASAANIFQASRGRPMGGLITSTPLLALGFAVLCDPPWRKRNLFLLVLSLGSIAVVSVMTPVDPGLQWGPRFLLPIFPPLTVLVLNNLTALSKATRRLRPRLLVMGPYISVVAASVLLQASGLRTMYIIKTRDVRLIENTQDIDTQYIVTDEYGYAQYVAPLYFERQLFYARSQEAYQTLTETFLANDVTTFAFVTYPFPGRRAVDPMLAAEGYSIKQVGHRLLEIEETGSDL